MASDVSLGCDYLSTSFKMGPPGSIMVVSAAEAEVHMAWTLPFKI